MSIDKAPTSQRKPKVSTLSSASQKLLKKTIARNLMAKACTSHQSLNASDSHQSHKLPEAPSIPHLALKRRGSREASASSGGVHAVPTMHLNLSLHRSGTDSPGAPLKAPGVFSSRSKPVTSSPSVTVGSVITLNLSLGTPRQSLHESPRSPECDQPEVVYPITAVQAAKLYMKQLSTYEQGEILEQKQIYFLGLGAAKIEGSASMVNYGYDDNHGDYKIVQKDHIMYRFEVLNVLGKGSFGQVCRCYDHKEKETVALKIIRNKQHFHKQGAVEVRILDHLRTHDSEDRMCVVKMKSHFMFRKHLCLTFELLSMNLYDFLKSNDYAGLSINLVRRFAIQLIIALRFIHASRIIHCDLKPENILLKHSNKSGIKVIDFGSACYEREQIYTYIQSRFYRAPEIMLGIPYTTRIDMWSLGCILAELFSGRPLFPGESEHELILCQMEVLGPPPSHLLEQATRKKLFFEANNAPKIVANSRGRKRMPSTKTLQSATKSTDPAFLNFISQCLSWDPQTRMTPDAALKHQWIMEGIAKMQQVADQSERQKAPGCSDNSDLSLNGAAKLR